jgi:signal transduction histidine kinase
VYIEKDLKATGLVKLNPELIQWAIENLMKNAMDALVLDGVERSPKIAIRSLVDQGQLIIEVEDSGVGMDPKTQKKVFAPGFSTKKRGWGLGLNLTRRIVEEYHSGTIEVFSSEPGKGTTMRIYLNMA